MSNSENPIGENGRKEIKVNKTEDASKLIDKYFENLNEKDYGKIEVRALAFDVPEVSIKKKTEEQDGKYAGISSVINVLESGKREMILEEIKNGASITAKSAAIEKVKAKVEKLKEKEEKKTSSAGGTEKPESRDR